MGGAYTVALVGFAENESATFESFFRLAARRPPAYQVQDEVMDAQILIVNADNLQAANKVAPSTTEASARRRVFVFFIQSSNSDGRHCAARARNTSSATGSRSEGSGLMMTTRTPRWCAPNTSPAAG